MTSRQAIAILLTGEIKRAEAYWVTFCNELPITASGDTIDEAIKSIGNAAQVYLDALRSVDYDAYSEKLDEIFDRSELPEAPTEAISEEQDHFRLPIKGQLAPTFIPEYA